LTCAPVQAHRAIATHVAFGFKNASRQRIGFDEAAALVEEPGLIKLLLDLHVKGVDEIKSQNASSKRLG